MSDTNTSFVINKKKLTTIASSAFIISLNVSVWEGRKKDKRVEEEIQHQKGANSRRAASVHKMLLPESPALESIKTHRNATRIWFNSITRPWNDGGGRMITTETWMNNAPEIGKAKERFDSLVNVFLANYSNEISKQAFELGALFNRAEYPTVEELRKAFKMEFVTEPMPLAGDFRIDINNEMLKDVQEQYEKHLLARLQAGNRELWERLRTHIEWVRERMEACLTHEEGQVEEEKILNDDGSVKEIKIKKKRRPKLYETMLEKGLQMCAELSALNVEGDPKLEEARRELEKTLSRLDIDSLKESKETQEATKKQMDDILAKFDF